MPAHRNDTKANAMYDLYSKGHSLSQVAIAFSVTRQSVFKMFAKREFAMRTIEPLPFIVWNGTKYTRRSNGYYARTSGNRRYLHQDVWESIHGPIPAGHEVHHQNENKEDNAISNLEILVSSAHGKRHSKTNKGFRDNQFKPGHKGEYYPRPR